MKVEEIEDGAKLPIGTRIEAPAGTKFVYVAPGAGVGIIPPADSRIARRLIRNGVREVCEDGLYSIEVFE